MYLGSLRWATQRAFRTLSLVCKQTSSSKRWLDRQSQDHYTKLARLDDYRSRAAYKLKQMDAKFKLFWPTATVVDLGFAPGSWSQVAAARVGVGGRVIGVDMLPARPPKGVTSIQGNFLSASVQNELRDMLRLPKAARILRKRDNIFINEEEADTARKEWEARALQLKQHRMSRNEGIVDAPEDSKPTYTVDVVLSDMCDTLPQESGFWLTSINSPYHRLANTSGLVARDHSASIDLCDAALTFAIENLKPGGSFVCKFYTGDEDHLLEARLKKVFKLVRRVKPDATRQASREMYFVCQKKRGAVDAATVFSDTDYPRTL